MAAPATEEAIRDVNRRYHDVAAGEYDAKWGISFGEIGRTQVRAKVVKLLGDPPGRFPRALEVGAGTGYFSLNLLQDGVIGEAVCTDISPGMLATLRANARRLGLDVHAVACEADDLPFPDASFDLVLGHAVLHHLPDLDAAFAEFRRVLRPGGVLLFAGEPSRNGDRLAAVPKGAGVRLAPLWRRAIGARAAPFGSLAPGAVVDGDDHALESSVDVHAFVPADLERRAQAAGFADVRVRGEELLANWFGWFNRTLESSADPADIPGPWTQYAYHGYLWLQKLDRVLLEPHLPARLFYNLMLAARRPA
jgi:ubiquinone/menaquinone biosynthesis C-methylase UbiE